MLLEWWSLTLGSTQREVVSLIYRHKLAAFSLARLEWILDCISKIHDSCLESAAQTGQQSEVKTSRSLLWAQKVNDEEVEVWKKVEVSIRRPFLVPQEKRVEGVANRWNEVGKKELVDHICQSRGSCVHLPQLPELLVKYYIRVSNLRILRYRWLVVAHLDSAFLERQDTWLSRNCCGENNWDNIHDQPLCELSQRGLGVSQISWPNPWVPMSVFGWDVREKRQQVIDGMADRFKDCRRLHIRKIFGLEAWKHGKEFQLGICSGDIFNSDSLWWLKLGLDLFQLGDLTRRSMRVNCLDGIMTKSTICHIWLLNFTQLWRADKSTTL